MRCVGCGSIGEYEQAALAFKSGRPVLWKNNSLQPFNHNPTPLLTKRNTICENVNSPILTQQFIIPAVFNLLKCFLAVCFKSTEIRSIFELNDDSNIRIFRLRLEQISWHCSRIFIILEWQRGERVARSLM